METHWLIARDFMLLGSFLLLATFLRSKIKVFQQYQIPNNIIAGFLMFAVGSLGISFLEIPADRFGRYIYHLFIITFIAMSLRKPQGKKSNSVYATALLMAVASGLQVIVGLVIAFVFMQFFIPDLFPTFGYYLLLGFSQGPGQAYSVAQAWEPMGFENAANIGLTFAAIGYIIAITLGLFLIKYLRKKYGIKQIHKTEGTHEETQRGIIKNLKNQPSAGELTTKNSVIDGLTFQVALVLFVYLITFLLLKGIEYVFQLLIPQEAAEQLISLLWGMHFIFGSLMALLTRRIMSHIGWGNIISDGLMTRISGSSLDFVVPAAIAAISISVFLDYIVIILTMSLIGGAVTFFVIVREMRKSGIDSPMERILAIFGTMTGTLSTGLTLTRIADPDFRTRAAQDQVLAAGVAVPFLLPLIVSIIIPVLGLNNGQLNKYYLINLGAIVFYISILYFHWKYFIKKIRRRQNKS